MTTTTATLLLAEKLQTMASDTKTDFTRMDYLNFSDITSVNRTNRIITDRVSQNGSGPSELSTELVLTLHCIIFLLALVGNGLVITTLAQNRRMRTITNIFLLNLAVSDLLLAIVCMPFTIIPVFMQNFIFGPVMCVLIRYLQAVTVSASAFTLVSISLERFYAICNPLQSRKWQNIRHSYKVLAAIWLTAMILNIPMAVFQTVVTSRNQLSLECTDRWPNEEARKVYYVFHLLVADLLVPLTIMSIAYGLIAKTLWNGFKNISVVDQPEIAALKAKRQMSLTSDVSDISDESEMPLNGAITPLSPISPNGDGVQPRYFSFNGNGHSKPAYKNSKSRQDNMSMRSHSSKQHVRSKKRVIKMLFVIVIEFFVCWTPLYLVMTWISIDPQSARASIKNPRVTISMLRLLAYISSCCNPITYCFMSKKFRTAFLTAFRCRKEMKPLHRRPTVQSTQISYCEGSSNPRAKLHLTLSGHNKLEALQETSQDNQSV